MIRSTIRVGGIAVVLVIVGLAVCAPQAQATSCCPTLSVQNANQASYMMTVADVTKPVITLKGSVFVTIEVGSEFVNPGASAFDDADGDITSKIITTGSVNTTRVGRYTITYNVTDTAGNAADAVIRTIDVVAKKGRVLGEETLLPTVSVLQGSKNVYTIYLESGTTKKIRPFAKTYTGAVWARQVTFGDIGSLYIFGTKDPWAQAAVYVYNGTGSRMQTVKPFGNATKWGMNFDIRVETMTNTAFVAIGSKKGSSARLFQLATMGLGNEKKLTAISKKIGSVVPQFIRLSSDNSYSLVTIVDKKKSSIRVWVFDPTDNLFVRDATYPLSNLKVVKGKVVRTW
ncbi:MAG: DUF5011 domain-containing protein [bacterium]